ncbi:MAG: virulence factor [Acidimicrobiia bacterium]
MAPKLVTIWWRDIPTQVNAQDGRTRYQAVLPRRFQRAVDEAAMAAGLTQATDYVSEWRRDAVALPAGLDSGALQTAADAAAARFDTEYSKERLTAIARNSGYEPASAS